MNEQLYTVLLDWNGGTFVSQVWGKNVNDAKAAWLSDFDRKVVDVSEKTFNDFRKDCMDEEETLLEGIKNVWCFSPFLADELALVHFVSTKSQPLA